MGKKNPYVFTIGFNKADPSHRVVVEILNEKGRGMAQYITEAVLAYHPGGEQTAWNMSDYDKIAAIVNEILNKRMDEGRMETTGGVRNISEPQVELPQGGVTLSGDEIDDIMGSLRFF